MIADKIITFTFLYLDESIKIQRSFIIKNEKCGHQLGNSLNNYILYNIDRPDINCLDYRNLSKANKRFKKNKKDESTHNTIVFKSPNFILGKHHYI